MEQSKVIAEYLNTLWNQRDTSIIPELFAEDISVESPFKQLTNIEEIRDYKKMWLRAFPDAKLIIDELTQENDRVIVNWHCMGTHLNKLFNISPSNALLEFNGRSQYTFVHNTTKVKHVYLGVNLAKIISYSHTRHEAASYLRAIWLH